MKTLLDDVPPSRPARGPRSPAKVSNSLTRSPPDVARGGRDAAVEYRGRGCESRGRGRGPLTRLGRRSWPPLGPSGPSRALSLDRAGSSGWTAGGQGLP